MMNSSAIVDHTSLSMEQQAVLANMIMSDEDKEPPKKSFLTSMKDDWGSSSRSSGKALFKQEDFSIFCDKEQDEIFIFHSPKLSCTIDFLEYNPETKRVMVFTKDGQQMDLGTRIQWLVRPYISTAKSVLMVRTERGQAVEGFEVLLKRKEKEEKVLN